MSPEVKIFLSFESPYITSYLTSIDTFSLSRIVFEIFDFKVFRVWPWPLTSEDHMGSKNVIPFESPYMTSYLTSMVTIFLSLTVFEIFDFKVFRGVFTNVLAITDSSNSEESHVGRQFLRMRWLADSGGPVLWRPGPFSNKFRGTY